MSFNPSQAYATNAASTDLAQEQVANLNTQYSSALIGNPQGKEQDELRGQLSRIYTLLGNLRGRAKELIIEQLEAQKARKDLINRELAIA